ncbi:DNA replication licensing factor mcm8 [Plakobranchus ocellatus]|uniref:DNA replication licensing factor mcm8 n=1 Tax=Plakobranchus ocellatus TaxID=259542 RepID=A0AAV4ASB0_9GAST|nr:DNA replication licensing factor mcm8 [Plakobranchus ocellatus]
MTAQHQALLEAMEQQSISIAKAGIVCSLPARTSIIAAANPVGGHYNKAKTVSENLKMGGALLSRFDLVFIMLDKPDEEMDGVLSEHVMALHAGTKSDKLMLRSIFIALPKKPGATECELHRTISLMSHVTKLLLRIIMMRVRNKIKPEIAEEQCGFVEGKGTTNAIYILRTLIERALEVQKDVNLCFIDYTKAFDRVRHDEIIKQLTQLKIDGKDLRIIKNMYWDQVSKYQARCQTRLCTLSRPFISL